MSCSVEVSGNNCGLETSHTIGYRCRNGCQGEGRKDEMCEYHARLWKKIIEGAKHYCRICGSTNVEVFDIQEVRV